ncbi:MAG: VCBS repeat-containing protein, partial [Gemmataceae bacterium]|nr:VCBS repeat-containing protein [Gemmataceae bacterium]
ETYFGVSWYQAYPQGDWWGMSHGEPYLLRSYAGKVEKLPAILDEILAGKEVIVPCMVDGDKEALHKKTARIQRMRASLKLLDYNPKRDFVGWGGDEIRRLEGYPAFEKYASLPRTDNEAQAVSAIDFTNDGKPDLCLCAAGKVVLLQNEGDGFVEVSLPGLTGGARAAVWADYNGDGLPDLLLATANGPRLFTNLAGRQFRDDTRLLPATAMHRPATAAAWGDFDADGKPDLLVAYGYHGLRLYRNNRPADALARSTPPKLGEWYAVGPFRHPGGMSNFDTRFAPETEPFDPNKVYKGKRDMPIKWTRKNYTDGAINSLVEFGNNCATYLYREIEAAAPMRLPVSLGSDDTLTVWLNGEKILSENVGRACAPDQNQAVLNLKAGKNTLLMKICNGEGDYAFYFAAGTPEPGGDPWFQDVSADWGLVADHPANQGRGDALAVADFNADGRPDVLYAAGQGLLLLNLNGRFVPKPDSGLTFQTGKVGPVLVDYDGDGHLDVLVPQRDGVCRLFRNDGNARFTDVTAAAGDLARPVPGLVAAAAGDLNNDGKPDLLLCCLRGPNRYLENSGHGVFTDKTQYSGLHQRVFNSQAATFVDLNGDGRLDLVLHNEGQESCVLFGALLPPEGRTAVQVSLNGTPALNGVRVVIRNGNGQPVATAPILGGHGRGGQCGLLPRFLLPPGTYKIEAVGPAGTLATANIQVAGSPLQVIRWN